MATQVQAALTIIRRKKVEARTGLSRSTIYDRIKSGTFPAPVSLGAQAVGWIESEIDNWLMARVEQSRSKSGVAK
jgi:prophage regulatory protein